MNEPGGRRKPAGVLRTTGLVGFGTLVSRVLGLVRDMVIAQVFGVSRVTEAFFIANKIPNMLRRFFAEGAFSQAFVPVLNEYREQRGERDVRELIAGVSGTLGLFLFVLTLLGVIAAPLLVYAFAPGYAGDDRFELTTAMLRLTFPYLLFISLTALAGGVLNTFGRFAVPAFTPVLLNLSLIGCAIWLAPRLAEPGLALAIGVFLAGVLQLAVQLPFLLRLKLLSVPRWRFRDPGVGKIRRLMLPALFGSSVAQINIVVDNIIATNLALGSVSWLYYSDRLMEFPLGVFGIALATVILPRLSSQHATANRQQFSATVSNAIDVSLVIAVPAAVGLAVLAGPLLATIFHRGAFTEFDTEMARLSLIAFSLGLIGFTLVKVLAPAYFSRQDTRTPVRVALVALFVNVGLNLIFVAAFWYSGRDGAHAGLALATSIAAVVNASLLYRGLRRDGHVLPSPGRWRLLAQIAAAAAAMALVLLWATPPLADWHEAAELRRAGWLAALVVLGVAVYAASAAAFGLKPGKLRFAV
ncbi:MAG: murein biosynthesis integral membrane protein MurJ [Pseudomonadota bacterium]